MQAGQGRICIDEPARTANLYNCRRPRDRPAADVEIFSVIDCERNCGLYRVELTERTRRVTVKDEYPTRLIGRHRDVECLRLGRPGWRRCRSGELLGDASVSKPNHQERKDAASRRAIYR